MNHLGDTNKMVGETPRTDAECGDYDRSGCWKSYINGECVQSDFARQLERELNAANDRIKRLEEAGDALYENSYPTRWDLPEANARKLKEQEAWLKAKEAKP